MELKCCLNRSTISLVCVLTKGHLSESQDSPDIDQRQRTAVLNVSSDLWQLHWRLESCVNTRARLGYATFDAQLRKAYWLLGSKLYVCLCARICYKLLITFLRVRSLWYEYARFEITRAMPGYARSCRRLYMGSQICAHGCRQARQILISESCLSVIPWHE